MKRNQSREYYKRNNISKKSIKKTPKKLKRFLNRFNQEQEKTYDINLKKKRSLQLSNFKKEKHFKKLKKKFLSEKKNPKFQKIKINKKNIILKKGQIKELNFYINELLKNPLKAKYNKKNPSKIKIPLEFNSLEEYQNIMIEIFLDEIRSKLKNHYESQDFYTKSKISIKIKYFLDNFYEDCTFFIKIPSKLKEEQKNIKEFFFNLKKNYYSMICLYIENKVFFGIRYCNFQDVNYLRFKFNKEILDYIKNPEKTGIFQCKYLTNLTSSFREFNFLLELNKTEINLFQKILKKNYLKTSKNLDIDFDNKLNEGQKNCIFNLLDGREIGLVQGPPGTGKSFTIIELIKIILEIEKNKKNEKKILICTPSNSALNQLILRFYSLGLFNYFGEKDTEKLKIIRLGNYNDKDFKILSKNLDYLLINKFKINVNELEKESELLKNKILKKKYKDEKEKSNFNHKIDQNYYKIKVTKKTIIKNILTDSKIIFTTLNSSSLKILKTLKNKISYLIIDESTQASEIQTILPLSLNPEKIFLFGDTKQLSPTTFHILSKEININRSLFERLEKIGYESFLLNYQYRMVPKICKFPNQYFYWNKLKNSLNVQKINYIDNNIKKFIDRVLYDKNLVFYNTIGITRKNNNSYYNLKEIEKIYNLVKKMDNYNIKNIGIISPYREQIKNIKKKLSNLKLPVECEINTIDGFQGKEKKIIILSCVKSVKEFSGEICPIGFLSDKKRLNVAITRSKFCLIIFGNVNTLKTNETWKKYIDYLIDNQFVIYNRNKNSSRKSVSYKKILIEVDYKFEKKKKRNRSTSSFKK